MARFVFLLSTERSGSNLLTALMDAHPEVSSPSPSHLFRLFANNVGNYGDLSRDEAWEALIDDVALNLECKLGVWRTEITREELRRSARVRAAAELLRLVYEKEAAAKNAGTLLVKENQTYRLAAFLLSSFPDCRFVYLVRDPRDVASSWLKTQSIPGGVERATSIWRQDQSRSLALYHQLRDSRRVLRCRYEDLLREPEAQLAALFEFLDLSPWPVTERFHAAGRAADNAAQIEAWQNIARPLMQENAGKYRRVLSPDDQRYVELACFELMLANGYRPEMVKDPPDPDLREEELSALRPRLAPGTYRIVDEGERAIRSRRLAAIDRVLARRLGDEGAALRARGAKDLR